MRLDNQTVLRVLTILEEYVDIDEAKSLAAKRKHQRADYRYHEGRASAFREALSVLHTEFDLEDESAP